MDDDRNLTNEFNRQFELRTGLTKRDKAKYWNTSENQQQWEEPIIQKRKRPNALIITGGMVIVVMAAAIVWNIAASSQKPSLAHKESGSGTEDEIQSAEAVAYAFLNETYPNRRLDWAREREIVEKHFVAYSEEALSYVPAQIEHRGHHVENGLARISFSARFDTGSFRMLNVMETADGLRVDWDSYARYCSESWDALLSGEASSAEVRVFVSPGDYHNVPFEDEEKWTCFRLMSPDLPERADIFAYAETGSLREMELKQIVMRAAEFRQHMTLTIQGHEASGGKRLFQITRVHAVGWVKSEQDIEFVWETR